MAFILFKWFAFFTGILSQPQYSTDFADKAIHPFYISVTEINHNAAEKSLEISCKIFTEDLENVLNKTANPKIELSNPKSKEQANRLIGQYLHAHLQLRVNGQPVTMELLGFEEEREATWTYLQVNNVTNVKKIEIVDSILYDSFAEQINLVHVTVSGNRKSSKVNNPESLVKMDF
ncbi:MAG TPA: DUF6702 family protein [Flavitalea sp.]|nr:DUF6702 family protein [Flavitalea sp.]